MKSVQGDYGYSHTAAVEWRNKLQGEIPLTICPVQGGHAASHESVRQLEIVSRECRRIKVEELTQMLRISVRTANPTIHCLGYSMDHCQEI